MVRLRGRLVGRFRGARTYPGHPRFVVWGREAKTQALVLAIGDGAVDVIECCGPCISFGECQHAWWRPRPSKPV